MDTDARLTEIEIRLSYQEQGQETLHTLVLALQGEIQVLKDRLSRIEGRLDDVATDGEPVVDPRDEPPPPHY